MTNLSDKQLAAATSSAALTICIAGPGAGKTKTLVHRITHLIATGTNPRDIVAITFTNDAADEIEKRLACQTCGGEGWYQSLNSNGEPEQDQCPCGGPVKLGYIGTLHGYVLRLLSRHGGLIGISERLAIADEETAKEVLAKAVTETGFCGRGDELQVALRQYAAPGHPLPKSKAQLAACAYHRMMRASGMTDFDSLLMMGQELAKSLKEQEAALGRHLLVDEFQDSGLEDAAIYDALPFAHKFYIGDADQSIYGFRGGSPDHLLALVEDPGRALHVLTDNYRSSEEIVHAADNLIGKNSGRVEKRMVAVRCQSGRPVAVARMRNEAAEMIFTAQDIQRALSDECPSAECAVLCRNNADVAAFRDCIESYGLPLAKVKRPKMPADWRTCRKLVSFFTNPYNDRLAQWMCELRFGKDQAQKMAEEARMALTSINERWMLVPATPGAPTMLDEMARCDVNQESIAIVREEMARLQAADPADRLPLLSLALAGLGAGGEDKPGIHVGTIHSAKGREWRAVWLPGWNEGFLPRKAGDEEERRLAYVAMTRAKDRLTITWPDNRRPHPNTTKTVPVEPSRFIGEAGLCMDGNA